MMKFGLCNDDFYNANKTLGFCCEKRPDLVALSMRGGCPQSGSVGWGMVRAHRHAKNYFLRWRILARIFRFLRPTFRRPLPVFFVPTDSYSLEGFDTSRGSGPRTHLFRT